MDLGKVARGVCKWIIKDKGAQELGVKRAPTLSSEKKVGIPSRKVI